MAFFLVDVLIGIANGYSAVTLKYRFLIWGWCCYSRVIARCVLTFSSNINATVYKTHFPLAKGAL